MNELFAADHEFVSRIEMFEGGSRVGLRGLRLEDQRFACVVTVGEGRIRRTEVYDTREDALRALAD